MKSTIVLIITIIAVSRCYAETIKLDKKKREKGAKGTGSKGDRRFNFDPCFVCYPKSSSNEGAKGDRRFSFDPCSVCYPKSSSKTFYTDQPSCRIFSLLS